MAICVTLNPDGTLAATGEPVESCTGFVLQSGSEYSQVALVQSLFEWPAPEVLTGWVMAAFTFVLAMNVMGYVVGAVVKMVSTERD